MGVRRLAMLVALALALTGLTAGSLAACASGGLKVGLAYAAGGPGDHGFNDSAFSGLNKARTELSGSISTVKALTARPDESEATEYDRLTLLCEAGYNPVIAVGFSYAGRNPATGPLARAAKQCPNTEFAIVDDDTVQARNVANLVFADEQGSFLMGVVAANKTATGSVGFVGACPEPVITRFLAGYQAGARAVRPGVHVDVAYLSNQAGTCDFTDVDKARSAAVRLYSGGTDIVFQVAGGAGVGVFEAAHDSGHLAIGVDADQYQTVDQKLRPVIVTSMVKHVDVAVFDFIKSVVQGRFTRGVHRYDLAGGGIGYATSGGQITDLIPTLDTYRQEIISGAITVPTTPS